MKSTMTRFLVLGTFVLAATLAACGGGPGGGTPPTNPPPTTQTPPSTPTPTPTPTYTVAGTVTACDSTYTGVGSEPGAGSACTPNSAISGAQVTLGALPCGNTSTGFSPCSTPASPTASATTDPTGAFSFANVSAGSYMLQVSNGSMYATLHARLTVSANSNAIYRLTQLSSNEQAWLTEFNSDRHTYNSSASGSLALDEYTQEMTRAISDYLSSSTCTSSGTCNDVSAYLTQYGSNGGIYTMAGIKAERCDWTITEPVFFTSGVPASQKSILSNPSTVWAGLANTLYAGGSVGTCVWAVAQ